MAKEVGLSQSAITRIWRTFGLKPHLVDTFKLSKDPQFIEKVRDVVGLYLAPPEHALVLCVDEKTQIQALDWSAPVLPMMPGMPERRTHDYVRGGVTTLFAALNTATGEVIGQIHRRHRAVEFRKFLVRIDREVPAGMDVHLICDNASTHKTPAIQRWLIAHPRFHVHFTPHQQLLAQPGRALVRPAHRQADTARCPQERPSPGEGHPGRLPRLVKAGRERPSQPGHARERQAPRPRRDHPGRPGPARDLERAVVSPGRLAAARAMPINTSTAGSARRGGGAVAAGRAVRRCPPGRTTKAAPLRRQIRRRQPGAKACRPALQRARRWPMV